MWSAFKGYLFGPSSAELELQSQLAEERARAARALEEAAAKAAAQQAAVLAEGARLAQVARDGEQEIQRKMEAMRRAQLLEKQLQAAAAADARARSLRWGVAPVHLAPTANMKHTIVLIGMTGSGECARCSTAGRQIDFHAEPASLTVVCWSSRQVHSAQHHGQLLPRRRSHS